MPKLNMRAVSLAALLIAFCASTAPASLMTITFGGDFSAGGDFNGLNAGTTFSASLTIDTATPDAAPGDPTFGDYAAVTAFSLDVGSFSFTSTTIAFSAIAVTDSIPDAYEATVSGQNALGDGVDVVLLLMDNEGTAFPSDALPTFFPLADFEQKQFSADIAPSGEVPSSMLGTLNAITPEPAALTLWLFGALALSRRRRR